MRAPSHEDSAGRARDRHRQAAQGPGEDREEGVRRIITDAIDARLNSLIDQPMHSVRRNASATIVFVIRFGGGDKRLPQFGPCSPVEPTFRPRLGDVGFRDNGSAFHSVEAGG